MAMGGGGCHAPLGFHRQPAPTLPRHRMDVRKGAICRLCTSPWRRSRASLRGSARGELAAERAGPACRMAGPSFAQERGGDGDTGDPGQ